MPNRTLIHLLRGFTNPRITIAFFAIAALIGAGILGAHLPYESAQAAQSYEPFAHGCHNEYTDSTQTIAWYEWGTNLSDPQSAWRIAWETGMDDWNDASTAKTVNIYRFPSEPNTINSLWLENEEWYGAFIASCPGQDGHWSEWDAYDNTYTTQGWSANERRSVAGHELGHLLGLDEGTDDELMDQGRDRSSIYVPQDMDIEYVDTVHDHVD